MRVRWCSDSFSGGSAAVLPQPRGPESTSTPLQRMETGSTRSQKKIPFISLTAEQHAVCCCTTTSDCLQETPVIKLSYTTENTGRLNTRQFTKDHQNPLTPCRTRPVYELTREADQLSSAAVDLARLVAVLCPVGGHVGVERVKSGPSGRAPEFEASFCSGQNRVMTSSCDALWP